MFFEACFLKNIATDTLILILNAYKKKVIKKLTRFVRQN